VGSLDSITDDPTGRQDVDLRETKVVVRTRGLSESFPLYLVVMEFPRGGRSGDSRRNARASPGVYDSLAIPTGEKRFPKFLVKTRL